MSHPRPAALLRAALLGVALTGAACARAQAASPFEELPRLEPPRTSHRLAYACGLAGLGLVAVSFPLADAADRRYAEYLSESDPHAIASRWDRTVVADRTASAALLAGEALFASAVYLRFIRPAHRRALALEFRPGRCALSCSF